MRRMKIKQVVGIMLVFMVLVSCSKKRLEEDIEQVEEVQTEATEEEEEVPAFESGDLTALYSEFAPETQVLVIDSGDSGIIRGVQGTEIYCGKDQLVNEDGDTIDYPYEIHLIEIYKPWEMIFGQIPTISGSQYLQCEGEVNILAMKDGGALSLKMEESYGIMIPSDSIIPGMGLFYSVEAGENTNWMEGSSVLSSWNSEVFYIDGVVAVDTGYLLGSTQLGWSACSKEPVMESELSIEFVSDSIPFSALDLYIVNKGLNSVVKVQDSTSIAISINENVIILAFAIDSQGNYFIVNEEKITPLDGKMELKFKSVDKADMIQQIKSL